jgi:hypothetical protein
LGLSDILPPNINVVESFSSENRHSTGRYDLLFSWKDAMDLRVIGKKTGAVQ